MPGVKTLSKLVLSGIGVGLASIDTSCCGADWTEDFFVYG